MKESPGGTCWTDFILKTMTESSVGRGNENELQ